jgi:hypothetical protein
MQGEDENNYGFKTRVQQILVGNICDINTWKGNHHDDINSFMADKDYYDDNLKTD